MNPDVDDTKCMQILDEKGNALRVIEWDAKGILRILDANAAGFVRNADGSSWTRYSPDCLEATVYNLQVDARGNLTYEHVNFGSSQKELAYSGLHGKSRQLVMMQFGSTSLHQEQPRSQPS